MFNFSSRRSYEHTEQKIFLFFFLFQMTPSVEIIRATDSPQFGDIYFGLKNQYKILLNIAK